MTQISNHEVGIQYATALKELNSSSKPHINNLTTIAKENKRFYKDIVAEIENRIGTAHPSQRLPVIYLMDSIIKNVGEPYITEFSNHLVDTFCLAYENEREEVRGSYMRVLMTWPQLIHAEIIQHIQRRIQSLPVASNPNQTQPFGQPALNRHDRNIAVNPNLFRPTNGHSPRTGSPQVNGNAKKTPELVKDFKELMAKTDPSILRQPHLLSQIKNINAALTRYQQKCTALNQSSNSGSTPSPYANSPASSINVSNPPKPFQAMPPSSSVPPAVSTTPIISPPSVTIQPANPADLINALINSGLLNKLPLDTPSTTNASTANTSPSTNTLTVPDTNDPNGAHQHPALRRLYHAFAFQCSNCGLRFNSKDKLDTHLDMHYMISSRRSKNKCLSRKWHQTEDDWIRLVEEVVVESPGAIFFGQFNAEPEPDGKEDEAAEVEVASEGVQVTESDQTQCPVCREQFELGRDSTTDEWIYKDTVRDAVSEEIVHKMCMRAYKRPNTHITPIKSE
ncbi:pre-mRNA cleavage complex 2 protein [Acrasis kona]|uniref:Pre-mRNA cleavage complex 2 protein n=1 Tax=Acrasis kona TaxID=1008807 RepID=A0AAW2Z6J5_9EUKA